MSRITIAPSEFTLPSGRMPASPRTDFLMLARRLGAGIALATPSAALRPVEDRVRLSVSQAARIRRQRPQQLVSLTERVGMPFALMERRGSESRARHIMVAHLLTSPQKRRIQEVTRFLDRIDVALAFSAPQVRYLVDQIGEERAGFVADKVDHTFFTPPVERPADTFVLAVGREQRDYPVLIEALRKTGISGVIVAGSTWSHRALGSFELPGHVRVVEGLSYPELLELYQSATLAVVPVRPGIDYAAGVNGLLEAMACALPVIASDTPGLEGYITEGVDGHRVKPGDADELADAIAGLWSDAQARARLGGAGRATVERDRSVEAFVDRIASALGPGA